MDQDGYPIYRRRNNGQAHIVREKEVDNKDIVPYNAYLSKRFNWHMNVEVSAGMRCVKYIHKYIYKGYDHTTMVLGLINEIQQYLDARYIEPPEVAWRIFGYPLHVEILAVSAVVGNRLIFEHQQLQNEAQQADVEIIIDRLNNDQRTTYDAITSSVFENKGIIFFLNGGAGTGKTFLYNAIALKCRSLGHIVITVASSGIASLLLHRHCVEAVDRTLRDTCDSEKPFGGITVVLGGDFRQILPIITKGVHEQIIGTNPQEIVKLPSTIYNFQDLKDIISVIYPQLDVAMTSTATFLTKRTILSARNDDVSAINTAALNIFPSNTHTYLAADKMSEEDEIDRTIINRYPNEYLNSLDPPRLPAFK
ncbi:uncharacterized protein LOC114305254, partial [Camellia sinensis]|uniref:uncharacterized protein LOC114305254 n=1 Tax=Camellia sinensis TaxID=4442 RepID=UPI0010355666